MGAQLGSTRLAIAAVLCAAAFGCKHGSGVGRAISHATSSAAKSGGKSSGSVSTTASATAKAGTAVAGAAKSGAARPVAGPVKPPKQGGARGGGTSVVVAPGAVSIHYGEGSSFFWNVGVMYRAGHDDLARGRAEAQPASLALLGSWPTGAEARPELGSPRSTLLELVNDAHVGIDLVAPAIGDAASVEPLTWALGEAADRGVRVRVLVGAGAPSAALHALAARRGVEVRSLSAELPLASSLLLVDRGEAILAGESFRGHARGPELAALVKAPSTVRALEDVFERDWARSGRTGDPAAAPPAGGYRLPEDAELTASQVASPDAPRLTLRPVFTPAGALPSEALASAAALAALIDSARASLNLMLPSVRGELHPEVAEAVARAVWRGVRVRALIDSAAAAEDLGPLDGEDVDLRRDAASTDAPEAVGFVTADGARSWLGSGGLSLRPARSAGLIVEGPSAARVLDRWFLAMWSASAEPIAAVR